MLGKNINLTGENVTISSNNFNVDKYGNMSCNSAKMNNANIDGGNLKMWGNTSLDGVRVFSDSSKNTEYMAYMISDSIGVNSGNNMAAMSPTAINIGSSTMYDDHITTPYVVQTSLESQKKNFKKFNNALDILRDIDIYKYNLKSENDKDKKHIGFVIGEDYKYSEEVTSKNNDGADIYSFVSLCCQAIKEQQEEIEELRKEINK